MSTQGRKVTIAWALQGGGARGAFQVGAYAAAEEAGLEGSIFSGISIGAFNGAIMAGNEPKNRLECLRSFWRTISRRGIPFPLPTEANYAYQHYVGWTQAMIFGQPGFFKPRLIPPQFAAAGSEGASSFYDTSSLRQTLLDHIDFDLINDTHAKARLFLGAVKVRTGEMVFFDNRKDTITPEHVMASGALPPGFPGIRIDGELYWDGGCHSNTALDVLIERVRGNHLHILMPILFSPDGPEPRTIEEVERRLMEIRYSSHSEHSIERLTRAHELRQKLGKALQHVDPKLQSELKAQLDSLLPESRNHDVRITHVSYNSPDYETSHNDADFAEASLQRREAAGYKAMREKLAELASCKQ